MKNQQFKSIHSIYDAAEAVELMVGFGLSSEEVGLYLGFSIRAVDYSVRNYFQTTLVERQDLKIITKESKV